MAFNCPVCGKPTENRSWDDAAAAAPCSVICAKEKLWRFRCPPLYRETDPSRLNQDDLKRIMAWEAKTKGLLLMGETGVGKTRAAYLVLRKHFDAGRQLLTFDATDFGDRCADAYAQGNGLIWMKGVTEADIVFLDDLGKCKFTERTETALFGVIEKRSAHLRPTLVTTNCNADQLSDQLGKTAKPLIRRLREFSDIILMKGGAV